MYYSLVTPSKSSYLLCVFTFWFPCCDFHIQRMFGSSLPPVVGTLWDPDVADVISAIIAMLIVSLNFLKERCWLLIKNKKQ